MKRRYSSPLVVLLFFALLALSACGSQANGNEQPSPDNPTVIDPPPHPGGAQPIGEGPSPPDGAPAGGPNGVLDPNNSNDSNRPVDSPPTDADAGEVGPADDGDGYSPHPCNGFSFDRPPVDIGTGLPANYEPSAADWHEDLHRLLLVSDEGVVTMMNADGSHVTNWNVGGDLEGITDVDDGGDFVYVGVEHPDGVKELNIATGQVTRIFDLTPWMKGPDNSGLEALIFVPSGSSPEGGYFYAGHQGEGSIYVFELPIKTSPRSTAVRFVRTFTPVAGRTDISDLDYDADLQMLYAIYDSANKLTTLTTDGTVVSEMNLPHDDQEGFARNRMCDVVVAQDSGRKVWLYKSDIRLLSERLVAIQNNDGSFDWQQDADAPLTPDITGFQNVTGVTALGLVGAVRLFDDPLWDAALEKTVTYLQGLLSALAANPSDTTKNISCPNWTLLAWHLQTHNDPALQTEVVNDFELLLNARDMAFGNDPGTRVDGWYQHIIQGRAGMPGLIPWDLALCASAAGAMAEIDGRFAADYRDALSLLTNYVQDVFLPAFLADGTLESADLSIALPLFVLSDGSPEIASANFLKELTGRLESLVAEDGHVSNGSANDDPFQASAYGLLALKRRQTFSAQKVQDYLRSLIRADGAIVDPALHMETYEVEGEILAALAYQMVR